MEEFFPVLLASRLFSGIAAAELQEMLTCLDAKVAQYPKEAFLLRAGERAESVGLVLSGTALVVQEDVWGNRNLLSQVRSGQTFAAAFACAQDAVLNVSVTAQSAVTALFLNVQRILTVCPAACAHHSRIIRNLLSELAENSLRVNEKLTHTSQRTTRAKLLSYFSAEAQRNGAYEFDIPFTRQQLADYLAVERSGLSAALSRLRADGLLEFRKNHFRLKTQDNP